MLRHRGKYAEAEVMHRQTLQMQKMVLGKENSDTLMRMMDLAISLHSQGKHLEAESIYWQ